MTEQIILDEKSREAIHAQRNAAQAVELARVQQIQEVADKVTRNIPNETTFAAIVRDQMENVLARGTEYEKSLILARVPYVCNDIKNISGSLEEIKEMLATYPMIKTLVFGFASAILSGAVGLAGLAMWMVFAT